MASWLLKSAIQGVISLMPGSQTWNSLFQKYVTGSLRLSQKAFEFKLAQCNQHLENYHAYSDRVDAPACVFELGTGWHPIVPIGLFLCGVQKVITIDSVKLLSDSTIGDVLRFFEIYGQYGKLKEKLPYMREERLEAFHRLLKSKPGVTPDEAMLKMNIVLKVCDARVTGLKGKSIDFIVSNNTLQHIREDILKDIFLEFRRIASPEAVMCHYIDMEDHYSKFDHSINSFNFLKYSRSLWRIFNNSLQYQNRLRLSDYRQIHASAAFRTAKIASETGSVADLDRIPIASEFRRYSPEELLVLRAWIISIPEPRGS